MKFWYFLCFSVSLESLSNENMVSRIGLALELHSAYVGLPTCSSWTALEICSIVESLVTKLYISVSQKNYGHTQLFLFAIDPPIVVVAITGQM